MILQLFKSSPNVQVLILAALFVSGCQSLPVNPVTTIDVDKAMPGQISQDRHAHVLTAINVLNQKLSSRRISLDGIRLDPFLERQGSALPAAYGDTPGVRVRQLAERELIAEGPYRLVQADTLSGRLEYRSDATGQHLSVNVSSPQGQSLVGSFVVTELYAQMSLTQLVSQWSDGSKVVNVDTSTTASTPGLIRVRLLNGSDDSSVLSHFNELPVVERERQDILGVRALLMMRMDQDRQATPLIEQGIVRYPESPLYFVLASLLFERTEEGKLPPESLKTIMRQRFTIGQVKEARSIIDRFLSESNSI